MTDSILDSIKKLVGLEADYTPFDVDITIHINSAFATLHQLGVGPTSGYQIVGQASKWNEFTQDDVTLNNVKTYIYVYVRIRFDPPTSAAALNAFQAMEKEYEWRLNVAGEQKEAANVGSQTGGT